MNGNVNLITEKADIGVSVNLRGLVGIATDLLRLFKENLIEIKGTGNLGEVKWERADSAIGKNRQPQKADEAEKEKPRGFKNRR